MRLEPGVRVGAYDIVGVLGVGGMGEVYRARDTNLKRDVAIKTLPDKFSRDPGRMARFQREAEVLASLNHAHIASIYELEESDESRFLILELVEGETLTERLARGAIPQDEAIRLAMQICEGIEAAHAKNVIHRDLKPDNIKIRPDGQLKLLDFGLARMFESEPDGHSPSTSPTAMTVAGVVLGTAAYMSPEQSRGKPVDKRTDIWAFGCVLFEMLTGRRAFGGETISDVIAAILNGNPDMDSLPKGTPFKLRQLLLRCLSRDLRSRFHDIADARIELEEVVGMPADSAPVEPAIKRRALAPLLGLGLVLCVLSVVGGMGIKSLLDRPPSLWSGSLLVGGSTVAWGPRVSPDGKRVAFIVMVDAQTQVALMDAESGNWDVLTTRPEDGVHLHAAWSRDGSKVYFTRGATTGVNVYSIPSVGGEERLVLDNAYFPEPLPDGSLLVTRVIGTNRPQLYQFRPEEGRLDPLPVFLSPGLDPLVPIRAFADGKEAVFFGRTMTPEGMSSQPDVYVIDLLSKQTRKAASDIGVNADLWPVSVDRDDFVLSDSPTGDLHRVVSIDRRDSRISRVLLTLTGRFSGLDVAEDGTVFVDQQNNTLEVLRIHPSGNSVQRIARAETYFLRSHTIEFPDGRVIVPSLVSGRPRLMLTRMNKLSTSLIDTSEDTAGPISRVGDDGIAFLLGNGATKSIAVASITDRRIVRKMVIADADSIVQLAASPDGGLLYYVSNDTVWEVPSDGGERRKIGSATSIAVDPNGKEIILQRIGSDSSVRLFRLPVSGGAEEEIEISNQVRMGYVPLAANAVNKEGKILVTTALTANVWYWQVSVFDPKTGDAEHVPTDFLGDILYAGWTPDGQILATGLNTEGSIWRFRQQTQ